MKQKKMFLATLILLAVALLTFYPLQAQSQVCFNLSPFAEVLEIGISAVGPPGDNFDLVGRHRGVGGIDQDAPVTGAAHVRLDGKAHFGTNSHTVNVNNHQVWIQGTLNPPSFNSGSGFFRNSGGGSGAITFTSAPCPISAHHLLGEGAGPSTATTTTTHP